MRAHTVALLQNASRGLLKHKTNAVCPKSVPQFLGHNTPIYEQGALISAVTAAVMQECCRKFPPRIFPEIHGGHTCIIVMEKKRFLISYIAGIIPLGPGRRYTLSIYSTTILLYSILVAGPSCKYGLPLIFSPYKIKGSGQNKVHLVGKWSK